MCFHSDLVGEALGTSRNLIVLPRLCHRTSLTFSQDSWQQFNRPFYVYTYHLENIFRQYARNDRVLYSSLYINEHPSPAYLQSSIEHFFAVNSADCRNGIRIQDNILFGVLGSHHSRYDFVDSNSSFTVE